MPTEDDLTHCCAQSTDAHVCGLEDCLMTLLPPGGLPIIPCRPKAQLFSTDAMAVIPPRCSAIIVASLFAGLEGYNALGCLGAAAERFCETFAQIREFRTCPQWWQRHPERTHRRRRLVCGDGDGAADGWDGDAHDLVGGVSTRIFPLYSVDAVGNTAIRAVWSAIGCVNVCPCP